MASVRSWLPFASLVLVCLALTGLPAQDAPEAAPADESSQEAPKEEVRPSLPQSWADAIDWRSIGPANMSGRITALAVVDSDPSMWWAASASGGLLKTTNNGITFEHQFDDQPTVSIGDVAVSQSDPNVLYVGTGESNPRNSVSWGNGVYKSTDGGDSWTHVGLEESYQIGRVVVHPTDPNIVYVAALGRLWGPSEMRGIYKSTDGGENWERVFFIDDRTGVIELRMHPENPNTLIAGAYERMRDGFDTNDPAVRFGEQAGMYKTTDGGTSWRRLENGLPTVRIGRIGLDYHRANPDIIVAVVETEKIGQEPENAPYAGLSGANADVGARITEVVEDGPAAKAGLQPGDIVVEVDREIIHSYGDLLAAVRKHVAGETAKLIVSRDRTTVTIDLALESWPEPEEDEDEEDAPERPQQNQGRRSPFAGSLGGQRENLQGQQGEDEHEYGGFYKSTDGGESWTRVNTLNPRPMYFSQVRIDPTDPNYIYVLGVSLYRSKDGGETFTGDGGSGNVHVDHHALWVDPSDGRHMILGNDGGVYVTHDRMDHWEHHNQFAIGQFYHVTVGPRRDYRVYGGLQDNGSWGGPSRARDASGPSNWHWLSIGGGDGFVCRVDANDPDLIYFESQNGGMGRRHIETGERARIRPRAPRGTRYRFNWQTPFVLSSHNSKIYYVAGNHVFRSLDRGDGLRAISPDITATERGSATAFAESPRDPDVLYVGSDDGAVWRTRDGGNSWQCLYMPEEEKKESVYFSLAPQDPDDDDPPAPTPPPRRGRLLERLRSFDENRDGKVARSEVPEQFAERMFDRLDANDDGFIDAKEMEAANTRRPGGRGGEAAAGEAPPEGEAPARGRRGGRRGARGDEPAADAEAPTEVVSNLPQLVSGARWVSGLVASRFEDGRVYLTLDGHRSDDDLPHVFVSEDHGTTWSSLRGNLPDGAGSVRTIDEDLRNGDTLYLGCEFGAWVSIDRGKTWTEFGGLPTVAVHSFAQHPTAGEIVAGTHGRSLWIADVTALRQVKKGTPSERAHLFTPNAAVLWRGGLRTGVGRTFVGENPPGGARITYSIGGERIGDVQILVESLDGDTLATLDGQTSRGLHETTWNLRREPRRGQQGGRFRRFGPPVDPGTYQVTLEVDGDRVATAPLTVSIDPEYPDPTWTEYEHLEEEFFRSDEDEGGDGDDDEAGSDL